MKRWTFTDVLAVLLAVVATVVQAAPPLTYAHAQSVGGASAGSRIGEAVAIDGDVMVVGAPYMDQWFGSMLVNNNGGIHLYRWIDGRWRSDRLIRLTELGIGPHPNARFGASVAVSGNTILVGCPGCGTGMSKVAMIDLPAYGSSAPIDWHPVNPPMQSPADAVSGIGAAVAIIGNIVAVGAPRATFGTPEFGGVSLGRISNGQVIWEDTRYGWQDSRFGSALDIARTRTSPTLPLFTHTVLVGAPQFVEAGVFGVAGRAMFLHRSASGEWSFGQEFENPDTGLADAMGSSVAIHRPNNTDNAYVAIGARGRGQQFGGTVRMYQRDPDTGWFEPTQELQQTAPGTYDFFGGALDLDGDRLVVGASGRAVGPFANAGSVFVYERRFLIALQTWRWQLRQTLSPPHNGDSEFGTAVALGGHTLAAGAPYATGGPSLADAGVVAIYHCDRLFAHGLESAVADVCAGP